MTEVNEILTFWFGESYAKNPFQNKAQWFEKNPAFDEVLRNKFMSLHDQARQGGLKHWEDAPRPCLALIILLDQFSRNMFRDAPLAFESDDHAQQLCLKVLRHKWDMQFILVERYFAYMPLMHAEDRILQELSLQMFQKLFSESEGDEKPIFESVRRYAVSHFEIIERFGRFPHRNHILGRTSSAEEVTFLQQPNSSF